MSTITSLQTTDTGSASRGIINTNFSNLNTDKLEKLGGTLTGEINFSGTTHAGVKLNNLTTTQRDALTPSAGMIIYNTTTGQVEKYESGSWVGSTGVANASSSVEGIVEIATSSEIDNDTAIGGTGAAIAITPDQLVLSKYGTGIPSSDQKAALAGTSGTPSSTNKYVTNDDTATSATANKVARRLAGGNITVVTESVGNNSTNAASTAYVDAATTYSILLFGGTAQTNATINYAGYGVTDTNGTEANAQVLMPTNGTIDHLYFSCNANNINGTTTFTVRKNTSNTTLTCAAATGVTTASDVAHSFTFVAGDLISIKMDSGGSSSTMTYPRLSVRVKHSS